MRGDLGWFSIISREYDAAVQRLRTSLESAPASNRFREARGLLHALVVSERWDEAAGAGGRVARRQRRRLAAGGDRR